MLCRFHSKIVIVRPVSAIRLIITEVGLTAEAGLTVQYLQWDLIIYYHYNKATNR